MGKNKPNPRIFVWRNIAILNEHYNFYILKYEIHNFQLKRCHDYFTHYPWYLNLNFKTILSPDLIQHKIAEDILVLKLHVREIGVSVEPHQIVNYPHLIYLDLLN